MSNDSKSSEIIMNPFASNNGFLTGTTIIETTNKISSANFQGEIHLKIKSRGKKKSTTFVEGLENTNLDLDKISAKWRKQFSCSVAYVPEEKVIKISGDKREEVAQYLLRENIATAEQIKMHGY